MSSAFGSGSVSDPLRLRDYTQDTPFAYYNPFKDTTGRTEIPLKLVAGERTAVLVGIGQSNIDNTVDGLWVPSNANLHNYSIADGSLHRAVEPLLGAYENDRLHGNILTIAGDKLIDADRYDRVIVCIIAMGSTEADQWNPAGVSASNMSHRIGVLARRLRSTPYNSTDTDRLIIWHQGEADAGGTTQAAHFAALSGMVGEFRAQGMDDPIFISKASFAAGALLVNSAEVRAAQDQAADTLTNCHRGPDTDTLDDVADRDITGTHFSASGGEAAADLVVAAIEDYLDS
jgi:hypothetical protein